LAGSVQVFGNVAETTHADGVMVATAPVGRPVRVSVRTVGKVVPTLGRIGSRYDAVPPGATVCTIPLPVLLLDVGVPRLMVYTASFSELSLADRKFVSPR